ncbi:TolC family protein [Nitrosomonas europaea]|uniref:TolC family protein n=1 Tax=candidate division WWE3 bacterium TaxID=2053526 RepID=A0A928TTF4_UNCKA|nr:TolC family protein [Nitrosomonas europaea]KXK48028.1 MAG: Outer membrane efflux protein [Nitrosomonas europaea]MBE7526052.1 TolC family protein [candidate division WWE3 bacterium]
MAQFKNHLPKIPIINRYFVTNTLFMALLMLFVPAYAQKAAFLTEAQTVEKVLQQASIQDWIKGTINEAQSDIEEYSHWENPTLYYLLDNPRLRDQNATEQSYMIKQSIDLSGRRKLRQSAAEFRLLSATDATQSRLALFKAKTRLYFFDVLYKQLRLQAISTWLQHLVELEKIIRKRALAGDVPGYDLKRLQREYASAVTHQQAEQAALHHSWELLNALWGDYDTVDFGSGVSGELLPAAPVALDQLLAALEQNPALQSLAKQKSAFNLNSEAAERWKIPKFNLGVGAKTFNATNYSDTALLVSIEIPLPLWNQNNAERIRYRAQAQKVDGKYRLEHQKTYGEIRGSWQELTGLLQAIQTFEQRGQTVSDELINIASISYQAGEIGVFELLDAYRERWAYDLDRLDLMHKARTASIELDRLTDTGIIP